MMQNNHKNYPVKFLTDSAQDRALLQDCAVLEAACIPDGWCYESFLSEVRRESGIVAVCMADAVCHNGHVIQDNISCQALKIAGFLTASFVCDTADLTNIAVTPAFRQQGIASALLEALLERLRLSGIKELFLEVRQSNISAIACYQKYGFRQVGIRKQFYQHPLEHAVLMQCKL